MKVLLSVLPWKYYSMKRNCVIIIKLWKLLLNVALYGRVCHVCQRTILLLAVFDYVKFSTCQDELCFMSELFLSAVAEGRGSDGVGGFCYVLVCSCLSLSSAVKYSVYTRLWSLCWCLNVCREWWKFIVFATFFLTWNRLPLCQAYQFEIQYAVWCW